MTVIGPKRWHVAAVAVLLGCMRTTAAAKSCVPTPGMPHEPVAASVWGDTARFSFLVGRDFDDPGSNTALIARLRPFGDYPALRAGANSWQASYTEMAALAAALAQMRADIDVLGGLCKALDDAAFEAAAFNGSSWTKSVDAVRTRVGALATRARALESALQGYSRALTAAAARYASAGYPANPLLPLGPEPPSVAPALADLWLRWRAIAADLESVGTGLPRSPDTTSDAGIIGLSAAETTLANTVDAAGAIGHAMPAPASLTPLLTGDYLYDACPIEDGRSYYLSNAYYQQTNGVLTAADNTTLVHPKGASPLGALSVAQIDAVQSWRFHKAGAGYWNLQPAAQASQFLDVLNDAATHYPLLLNAATNGGPSYTGQFWRCYATDTPGRYRFSNRFLGETFSIDTYSDSPRVIMDTTGGYAAQYWGLIPK